MICPPICTSNEWPAWHSGGIVKMYTGAFAAIGAGSGMPWAQTLHSSAPESAHGLRLLQYYSLLGSCYPANKKPIARTYRSHLSCLDKLSASHRGPTWHCTSSEKPKIAPPF